MNLPRGFWWNPDTADSRFVFHSQIDPINRANDPGPNFPWNRVVEETLSAEPVPAPLPAPVEPPISAERYRREGRLEALATMRTATNAAFDALEREWS